MNIKTNSTLAGLDRQGKGHITEGDLRAAVHKMRLMRWVVFTLSLLVFIFIVCTACTMYVLIMVTREVYVKDGRLKDNEGNSLSTLAQVDKLEGVGSITGADGRRLTVEEWAAAQGRRLQETEVPTVPTLSPSTFTPTSPTFLPTLSPSSTPTFVPSTFTPTSPTFLPTLSPSSTPTSAPTDSPTFLSSLELTTMQISRPYVLATIQSYSNGQVNWVVPLPDGTTRTVEIHGTTGDVDAWGVCESCEGDYTWYVDCPDLDSTGQCPITTRLQHSVERRRLGLAALERRAASIDSNGNVDSSNDDPLDRALSSKSCK
jgi:hypothetical protein